MASELELPNAAVGTRAASVHIRLHPIGVDPDLRGERGGQGLWGRASADRFELRANGIARFRVERGEQILVDPFPGADPDAVRGVLMSTVLAALLQQRGFLVLHGGVVEHKGLVIALVGRSGGGKSTLVSYLHREGATVYTDEVCAVRANASGSMLAWPVSPEIALCHDAFCRQCQDRGREVAVGPIEGKLRTRATRFAHGPGVLDAVVVLRRSAKGFSWEALRGGRRLAALWHHTYLKWVLGDMQAEESHLRQCAALISQARFRMVNRPWEQVDERDYVAQIDLSLANGQR